jgi:hypothetical protein
MKSLIPCRTLFFGALNSQEKCRNQSVSRARQSVSGQENDSETSDGMPTHFQAYGFTAGMLDCKEQLESLPIRTYH